MNYKLSHIISIGEEIKVLLADELEYSIDRQAFEEYITEGTGKYEYTLDHYEPVTGHKQTSHVMTIEEYWYDALDAYTAQCSHIEDYIEQAATVQRDIDAKRRFATILDVIKDLEPPLMGRITSAVLDYGKAMAEYGMEVNR